MKIALVHKKSDWFYEFRPFLILAIGIVGLFNQHFIGDHTLVRISQVCGLILIYSALKIYHWRYEYRQQRSDQ